MIKFNIGLQGLKSLNKDEKSEFLFFHQILSLQYTFPERMEKVIDAKLKKQIKQIINMQTLLDQYDRQNRYLNRKVLQLLEENKILKIDKIKHNMVTQPTDVAKIKKENRDCKQNGLKVREKCKQQYQAIQENSKIRLKKDQGVQATSIATCMQDQSVSNAQLTKESSQALSFGSQTALAPLIKQDKLNRQQPLQNTANFAISPQKTAKFKQSLKIQLWRTPIQHIQGNKHLKLEDLQEQKSCDQFFLKNNFSRQSLSINRYRNKMKSGHAIEPSRKIQPAKSSKNLLARNADKSEQRPSSFSCLTPENRQKRKKFIDLISNKQKNIKLERKLLDCC